MVRSVLAFASVAVLAACVSSVDPDNLLAEPLVPPPENLFADMAPLETDGSIPVWQDAAYDPFRSTTLRRFASEDEFKTWLLRLNGLSDEDALEMEEDDFGGGPFPTGTPPPLPAPMAESLASDTIVVTAARVGTAPADPANPEITNNQISGVDEGDIVKQIGDHLVILQDGRLFIANLKPGGEDGLTLDARANVYRSSEEDTWYDELLVAGRTILVTGYSYREDATEFTVLRLNEDASVTRQATFYLASEDYYSSDNYATRMIDGKLVIHTPIYLNGQGWWDAFDPPKIREWQKESAEGDRIDRKDLGEPLFRAEDIWMPVQRVSDPVIHTVTVCDISGATDKTAPACKSNAIVGSETFEFLVTQDAFWLWMSPGGNETYADAGDDDRRYETLCENEERPNFAEVAEGALVKLPIDGGTPQVVQVSGHPQNQFSMDMENGEFRALVDWDAAMCPRWMGTETAQLSYMATPLDSLSDTLKPVAQSSYTAVPSPKGPSYEARFTPDYLVYGGRSTWGDYPPSPEDSEARDTGQAIVLPTADPSSPIYVNLPHGVIRTERAGPYMAITGYKDVTGLNVSLIDLRDAPHLAGTIILRDRYESENRSHAFNARIAADGTGLIGVPTVRNEDDSGRYWFWSDSSDMTYIGVRENGSLTFSGTLRSDPDFQENTDYDCEVSCVDWYGNARPIFTGGRVIALLNAELVEGRMESGYLRETRRLNLFQNPGRDIADSGSSASAP